MTNNVSSKVTIRFKIKRLSEHNSKRKDKTLIYEQPMQINLNKTKPYSKNIKILNDNNSESLCSLIKKLNS